MYATERSAGVLNEFARAVYSLGRAFRSVIPSEPAPYWTDYLRETRDRRA